MAGRPKKTDSSTITKKTVAKTPTVEKVAAKSEIATNNTVKTEVKTEARSYAKKTQIPMDYEIPIKSNVQGILVYLSKKTGFETQWGQMGDIAYIEYSELITMRNTARAFFEDNWIIVEDTDEYTAEEVLYALNVDKYYKGIMNLDSIDEIFDLSIDKIKEIVPTLSKGCKRNVISRAMALIKENDSRLDSSSKVRTLEEILEVKLVEEI